MGGVCDKVTRLNDVESSVEPQSVFPVSQMEESLGGASQHMLQNGPDYNVNISRDRLFDKYTLKRILRRHDKGEVLTAETTFDGTEVAVKTITKKQLTNPTLDLHDLDILRRISHEHILNLLDIFETKAQIYVIYSGQMQMDLSDYIYQYGILEESTCRKISYQACHALSYLHSHSICHRDVGPESIYFRTKSKFTKSDLPRSNSPGSSQNTSIQQNPGTTNQEILENPEIVLSGFETSKYLPKEKLMHSLVGTPEFTAPEILKCQPYSFSVDSWSLGCTLFLLFTGRSPFELDGFYDAKLLYKRIKMGRFVFPSEHFGELEPAVRDFLNGLLKLKVEDRLTPEKALEHIWLNHTCLTTISHD